MATSDPLQLDKLPFEIIHRILAHGPCTNAITASCVNQRLRSITANPLLYQAITQNGNGYHVRQPSHWEDFFTDKWVPQGLKAQTDWRICARWALADMKARQALVEGSEVEVNSLHMTPFLPELLSKRHTVALDLLRWETEHTKHIYDNALWKGHVTGSRELNNQLDDVEDLTRATFVYACRCTLMFGSSREATVPASSDLRREPHRLEWYVPYPLSQALYDFIGIWKDDHDLWGARELLMSTNMMSTWQNDRDQEMHWLRCVTLSTLMAGIMHRRLSWALDMLALGFRGEDGRRVTIMPPKAWHIPFESFLTDVTSPFTRPERSGETASFITQHVTQMTKPEFLADGEWVGYYNYTSQQLMPQWDSVMHGIFFQITADYADHCAVSAGGEDGIGSFTILGVINKTTGWIQMTKEYIGIGTSWSWSAIMTPFGIVGAWGEGWGGWFWLWKRAWSNTVFGH